VDPAHAADIIRTAAAVQWSFPTLRMSVEDIIPAIPRRLRAMDTATGTVTIRLITEILGTARLHMDLIHLSSRPW
jgi:hypothetical protein